MSDAAPTHMLIEPRILKGFRDYLPEAMIPREWLIDTARRVYRSYGFSPIDTPTLEHLDILLGKGGDETDKQLYRFEDAGGRPVGMRFDLTVPLARFVAQHFAELGLPFKRYHIATVWRGENPQAGRYREFMQCDFDTIGTRSVAADIETALVIHDLFRALKIDDFTLHLNSRQALNGFLEHLGLADKSAELLRALDKIDKIGREKVAEEMIATAGAKSEQADRFLRLAEITGGADESLKQLAALVAGNEQGEAGVGRLADVVSALRAAGVAEERFKIAPAIARGLGYYTGIVYETTLNQLPSIGSVCSGGRYDNLAGLYTKQDLPGIGASLGLDRLLTALEKLGRIENVSTPAAVFIPYFDAGRLHDYLRLAAQIRASGFGVEVYPEPKKLGAQLKHADRRGFLAALIIGENEFAAGECQVKILCSRKEAKVLLAEDAREVIELLTKELPASARSQFQPS